MVWGRLRVTKCEGGWPEEHETNQVGVEEAAPCEEEWQEHWVEWAHYAQADSEAHEEVD